MNQALGLAGNVDASSLLAIGKGKVFNPFQEQIFSNMNFRTHQFTFKFILDLSKKQEWSNYR